MGKARLEQARLGKALLAGMSHGFPQTRPMDSYRHINSHRPMGSPGPMESRPQDRCQDLAFRYIEVIPFSNVR